MAKRTIVACVCVFFCIAMLSLGCKKGCGTCKSYGYSSGASYNYYGYTDNYYQGFTSQVCYNNFCTCPNGFEGDSCQIYSINKFLQPSSNWAVTDGCSGNPSYTVYVSTNLSNPYTSFYINNLITSGTQVLVYIESSPNNQSTGLYIPPYTAGAVTFSSIAGTYSTAGGGAGRMSFTMDYNNNGIDQNCTLYLYQQ